MLFQHTMTIEELYNYAINDLSNEHRFVVIGIIDEVMAQQINVATGLFLKDYLVVIDNYAIKHVIEKHGDVEKESIIEQIAVVKNDFRKIMEIVAKPDSIYLSKRQKRIQSDITETLIFEKQIGAYFYVLKEIKKSSKKTKLNRLLLQTMYKTKKRRTF